MIYHQENPKTPKPQNPNESLLSIVEVLVDYEGFFMSNQYIVFECIPA